MAAHAQKVGMITTVSLLGVAIIVDLIQLATKLLHFIPVIGNMSAVLIGMFLTMMSFVIFPLWMQIAGILRMYHLLPLLFTTSAEIIPLVNAVPGWTGFIAFSIFVANRKAKYNKQTQ